MLIFAGITTVVLSLYFAWKSLRAAEVYVGDKNTAGVLWEVLLVLLSVWFTVQMTAAVLEQARIESLPYCPKKIHVDQASRITLNCRGVR